MIFDAFRNVGLYDGAVARLGEAIAYARSFDPRAEDGRYEIAGRDVYANVASYVTRDAREIPFEAHRDYIDVQILLAGDERLDLAAAEGLESLQGYSSEKDLALYKAPGRFSSVILVPGTFAVLWPHEAHRPGVAVGEVDDVRKMVVKIRVDGV